ncbi:hypothetical protein BS47DRAFT_1465754 [Hydnum rufescens UP504]|uniref:Uncharacterized protein n=1 Tax=Hydnum rufescens UP504 TaxID=1448309 RepID=A0A9P6AV59_9AGAM|nr:hypothetical protein BS47DRAFT_1465754 [Hydnum rufescens UP504]
MIFGWVDLLDGTAFGSAVLAKQTTEVEKGLDSERKKNWGYGIEENDLATKVLLDATGTVQKKYRKDLNQLKPDLAALGFVPGTLARVSSSSSVAQRLTSADSINKPGNSRARDSMRMKEISLMHNKVFNKKVVHKGDFTGLYFSIWFDHTYLLDSVPCPPPHTILGPSKGLCT